MDTIKTTTVLFDFDGVIMNIETRCSPFWYKAGVDYLDMDDLENHMRGQMLTCIYDTLFGEKAKKQEGVTAALICFEQEMDYDYIPGVLDFVADLCRNHAQMAVVTSSNDQKMAAIYCARPEVRITFDRILMAEVFTRSKSAPDCLLLGMEVFETAPDTTYVFEDSFNGPKADMASKATVIGLATANPHESIVPLYHYVLDDSKGSTYDKMFQAYE